MTPKEIKELIVLSLCGSLLGMVIGLISSITVFGSVLHENASLMRVSVITIGVLIPTLSPIVIYYELLESPTWCEEDL